MPAPPPYSLFSHCSSRTGCSERRGSKEEEHAWPTDRSCRREKFPVILIKLSSNISSLAGSSWDRRKVVSHSNTFTSSALLLFSILLRPLVDDMSTMSLVARLCISWLEDRIFVASSCLSEGLSTPGRKRMSPFLPSPPLIMATLYTSGQLFSTSSSTLCSRDLKVEVWLLSSNDFSNSTTTSTKNSAVSSTMCTFFTLDTLHTTSISCNSSVVQESFTSPLGGCR